MKHLLILVSLAAILFSGCVGPASPERQAFNITQTSVTTADAAIRAWFVYVQNEENAIAAMKKAGDSEYITRRSELTKREGRVLNAWETYHESAAAFVRQSAAGVAPSVASRSAAEAYLIQTVNQLSK